MAVPNCEFYEAASTGCGLTGLLEDLLEDAVRRVRQHHDSESPDQKGQVRPTSLSQRFFSGLQVLLDSLQVAIPQRTQARGAAESNQDNSGNTEPQPRARRADPGRLSQPTSDRATKAMRPGTVDAAAQHRIMAPRSFSPGPAARTRRGCCPSSGEARA